MSAIDQRARDTGADGNGKATESVEEQVNSNASLFEIPKELRVPLCLTIAGSFATAGAVSLVIGCTWNANRILYAAVLTGAVALLLALAAGFFALRYYCINCKCQPGVGTFEDSDPERKRLFLRYQIGIGFAMLLLGIISVFVFAGLVHRLLPTPGNGSLEFEFANPLYLIRQLILGDDLAARCSLRIILSLNMAVLGALFFVANSLRKKRMCKEPFDSSIFWGGLWYRIGEAVLFTLVFLLVIYWAKDGRIEDYACAYDTWMPLLALMLGMFVKTGERLVFGMAERIFAGAASMLPVQPDVLKPISKAPTIHDRDGNENEDGGVPSK